MKLPDIDLSAAFCAKLLKVKRLRRDFFESDADTFAREMYAQPLESDASGRRVRGPSLARSVLGLEESPRVSRRSLGALLERIYTVDLEHSMLLHHPERPQPKAPPLTSPMLEDSTAAASSSASTRAASVSADLDAEADRCGTSVFSSRSESQHPSGLSPTAPGSEANPLDPLSQSASNFARLLNTAHGANTRKAAIAEFFGALTPARRYELKKELALEPVEPMDPKVLESKVRKEMSTLAEAIALYSTDERRAGDGSKGVIGLVSAETGALAPYDLQRDIDMKCVRCICVNLL